MLSTVIYISNTKKLTLTKVVQLTNNRGTIAQAQKAAQQTRRFTQGLEQALGMPEEPEQALE
jgi:hypothetical protein